MSASPATAATGAAPVLTLLGADTGAGAVCVGDVCLVPEQPR